VDISVTPSTFWGTLVADVKTPEAVDIGKGYTNMTFSVASGVGNTGSPQVGDLVCFAGSFHEQAKITSVSGSGPWTLVVPLRNPHEANSWIIANGTCGTFIDFTANDYIGSQTIRYPVDILGATDAHTLLYRYFSAYSNASYYPGNVLWSAPVVSLSNTAGVVSFVGINYNSEGFYGQPALTISNASNPDFNGACTSSVALSAANPVLTCTQSSSTGETSGPATVGIGSSPYGNTAFVLYPGAELLDMLDYSVSNCSAVVDAQNNHKTAPCNDGLFTLEPNNVAWTAGDSVENSHHYTTLIHGGRRSLQVLNPMSIASDGLNFGLSGPGIGGGQAGSGGFAAHMMQNYNPSSFYMGHGGTRTPPGGYNLYGMFNYGLNLLYAPEPYGRAYGMYIGCPIAGCATAAASYYPFYLKGNGNDAYLNYIPSTNTLAMGAASLDMYYTPILTLKTQSRANGQAATLGFNSIDSGGVSHAWTISAPVTGGGYTLTLPQEQGTLALTADLPATFAGSGTSHKGGLVPDPGASAGTTKFLREDATWQTALTSIPNTTVTAGSYTSANISVGADGRITSASNGSGGSGTAISNVPPGLQFTGDGSDGAYTCASGTCTIATGEYWYSSFNVSLGATVTISTGTRLPFVVRSSGTCTIAGTILLDGIATNGANWGGGGGGGGGGTLIGGTGVSAYGNTGAGSAGGAGGGNGTSGSTSSPSMQKAAISGQFPAGVISQTNEWGFGGAAGGVGGSSGPAGGAGGAGMVMSCQTMNFTGTISSKGNNGANSTGNNIGASGGGGGGPIILRSPTMTNAGTISVTGGTGGSCLSYTGCGTGGNGGNGWSMVFSN
jgi:hypothetical protein